MHLSPLLFHRSRRLAAVFGTHPGHAAVCFVHISISDRFPSQRAIFKTGNGKSRNGNGERGTGNGESLKWGIFKSGNL